MIRLRTLALTLGSVGFALLVAELVLRASTPATWGQGASSPVAPWIVDDPILGFANAPDIEYKAFRINEHGFRGPEPSVDEGVTRIACLGDSSTFGLWLDGASDNFEDSWIRFEGYPLEFARLLAESGRDDVEVVNAGVAGYTSSHGLRQLITRVLPLAPDVVIVRFGLNDHKLENARSGRRIVEPDTSLGRWLLYRFESWRLSRLVLRAWRSFEWLRPDGPDVPWVAPERFERNLQRFAEIAREHDFHLLVVDYPLRPLAWGEHPHYKHVYGPSGYGSLAGFHAVHARYQAIARRVAAEEGVAYLETGPSFRRRAEPHHGNWDFVHPNAQGAKKLAQLVLDELVTLAWIDPD